MIGVIEMMVMMTIDAMISRHIVESERQDMSRFDLDLSEQSLRTFGSIVVGLLCRSVPVKPKRYLLDYNQESLNFKQK